MKELNLNSLNLVKGSPKPFTPASISNLAIWVKVDSGVLNNAGANASNGEAVKTWTNLATGGNFTQGTAGSRPLFVTNVQNGLPAVRFDGTDDYLSNTTFAGSSAMTIFVVTKATTSTFVSKRFFSTNSATASVLASGSFQYVNNQAAGVVDLGGIDTNPSIISLNYASTSSVTGAVNGTAVAAFDPNDSFASATGFTLAATDNTGALPVDCDIHEVIVYNASLSTSDMTNVTNYLSTKYAIALS